MRSVFAILILILVCSLRPSSSSKKIYITGFTQGTTYHITYYAADSIVTKFQIDSILNTIDSSLSLYKPYSLINKFNASSLGTTIDDHFIAVVKKSIFTWQATNGQFDITVQPLVQAWGFGATKTDTLPSAASIAALKKCVGSQLIRLEGNRLIKLKPCVTIDANGIAQGYSVDALAGFLELNGIQNYIAEIGGEIRLKGRKQPGNETMKIGIESPGDNEFATSLMQQIIQTDSGAITTSGSYRKYYESAGKKITHIIDPKSGYPVQNELISVTVYARDAITADAFDNALMLMGLKNALKFVEGRKDIAAYFIFHRKNGVIADTASRQFYKLLKIKK
jgi:thiamine biosynthesis lipoprotein